MCGVSPGSGTIPAFARFLFARLTAGRSTRLRMLLGFIGPPLEAENTLPSGCARTPALCVASSSCSTGSRSILRMPASVLDARTVILPAARSRSRQRSSTSSLIRRPENTSVARIVRRGVRAFSSRSSSPAASLNAWTLAAESPATRVWASRPSVGGAGPWPGSWGCARTRRPARGSVRAG